MVGRWRYVKPRQPGQVRRLRSVRSDKAATLAISGPISTDDGCLHIDGQDLRPLDRHRQRRWRVRVVSRRSGRACTASSPSTGWQAGDEILTLLKGNGQAPGRTSGAAPARKRHPRCPSCTEPRPRCLARLYHARPGRSVSGKTFPFSLAHGRHTAHVHVVFEISPFHHRAMGFGNSRSMNCS